MTLASGQIVESAISIGEIYGSLESEKGGDFKQSSHDVTTEKQAAERETDATVQQ